MNNTQQAEQKRKPEHPILPIFIRRWSPRAMSGQPLSDAEILSLFEAARWAPSTYNEQEWRFLYARRDTPQWPAFFDLLVEGNKQWCKNAGLLCVVIAHKVFTRTGKSNPVHVFDSGLAYENLALQGAALDLVIHAMQGFDFEKARQSLAIPEDYAVCAMFAAGKPGKLEDLPPEPRDNESPSGRKPVREIICEGRFALPS
ncbi:MAG TPA: nitroreductase family protein [Candidatus Dormibacteraeota bacterium]|nr:nitroreductase family protein [Candidatus Dormibacteraeota bacterium]